MLMLWEWSSIHSQTAATYSSMPSIHLLTLFCSQPYSFVINSYLEFRPFGLASSHQLRPDRSQAQSIELFGWICFSSGPVDHFVSLPHSATSRIVNQGSVSGWLFIIHIYFLFKKEKRKEMTGISSYIIPVLFRDALRRVYNIHIYEYK